MQKKKVLEETRLGMGQSLAALALMVMVPRARVPVGYMLAPAREGVIAVTLCSGHGPVDAFPDRETSDIRSADAMALGTCAA